MPKLITGLLVGKFMPPHIGHRTLIDFARRMCDELTVFVCSHPDEPIPGRLRYEWMAKDFPEVRVVHIDADLPACPGECPDRFYEAWREVLLGHLKRLPDYVFAGEPYGLPFAQSLNAHFIPLDRKDLPFEISATSIRENLAEYWDYLLPAARLHYLKRVAIIGPESVGKSTLARTLANHFQTVYAPEYGRIYTDPHGMDLSLQDFLHIANGHRALEDALARQARLVLISDTEAVVTAMWAQFLIGSIPAPLAALAAESRYDLYLLSTPDAPWIQDGTRVQGDQAIRDTFFQGCADLLANRPTLTLTGTWDERTAQAIDAVTTLIHS